MSVAMRKYKSYVCHCEKKGGQGLREKQGRGTVTSVNHVHNRFYVRLLDLGDRTNI